MNSLLLSSLLAVVLGATLIGGVAYLYPSQGQLRSTMAGPAPAEFAAQGSAQGSAQAINQQTIGSLGGNQSSLTQLLAIIGGSAIIGGAVSLASRRAS
ncbi:MAG: hypothetical protein E6K95_06825 [Thaumarchaeota archaeon]|nr:MAG: hypothetical protein E6K95_06825 [Nitrososphaerota archaeon]TLY12843.1 MAG: hypothetical protein E6K86_10925 [Nitrososphaerota archaeon]TMQ01413.1 MAG: hypothetical protein E6K99_00130 [Nitrososphaerota archaeon]